MNAQDSLISHTSLYCAVRVGDVFIGSNLKNQVISVNHHRMTCSRDPNRIEINSVLFILITISKKATMQPQMVKLGMDLSMLDTI
jgi:hypothetical protein